MNLNSQKWHLARPHLSKTGYSEISRRIRQPVLQVLINKRAWRALRYKISCLIESIIFCLWNFTTVLGGPVVKLTHVLQRQKDEAGSPDHPFCSLLSEPRLQSDPLAQDLVLPLQPVTWILWKMRLNYILKNQKKLDTGSFEKHVNFIGLGKIGLSSQSPSFLLLTSCYGLNMLLKTSCVRHSISICMKKWDPWEVHGAASPCVSLWVYGPRAMSWAALVSEELFLVSLLLWVMSLSATLQWGGSWMPSASSTMH